MSIASRIEFAFGVDLTADPATWVWTDVSSFALGSVSIRPGRSDEASTTQPATCQFRLRNTDARFSPRFPTSPYYPYMRRQTPVRVYLNPGLVMQVTDTFTRTVSSGWGTPDVGPAWTTSGGSASDYSTNGTLGVMSIGSVNVTRTATTPVALADFDVTTSRIGVTAGPLGAPFEYGLRGRISGSDFVDARLFFGLGGLFTMAVRQFVGGVETFVGFPDPGITAFANPAMRLQAIGGTLRAKAWTAGTPEPSAWTVTMTTTHLAAGPVQANVVFDVGNTNVLPVQVTFDDLSVTTPPRFQGYVDEFKPTWPAGNSSVAEVEVTASGILRRLDQGSAPVRSALYRAISQAGPVAYWPLEDGADASWAASGILGAAPLLVSFGKVTFASASGLPSSAPLADFSTGGVGGSMVGTVPAGTSATAWRIEFVTKFNALPPGSFAAAVQWFTGGGVDLWEIDATEFAGGGLNLQYITAAGAFGGPFLSNVAVDDGLWHHIRVDASQSGGDIALTVKLDGTTVITQTLAALTMGSVKTVLINPTGDPSEQVPAIGHLAVWAPFSSSVDTVAAWRGNAGETAGARIVRLCAENNVPASVSSTTGTALMGPQTVAPILTLLHECEAADGGILYDGASAGLTYLARQDRYNLTVSLALDCMRQQVKLPFLPTEDDQRVRNDWTVRQTAGTSDRYRDAVHIAANNLYADSTTLNIQYAIDLKDQAGWRTHLGTVDEMRVPGLSLELIDHPELWASWLATSLGERVTAVNLPVQYPPGTLDMIVEGYTETWDAVSWRVDFTTSPFAPWRIFTIAADTGDTGAFVGHLDTDDSALNAGITTTAASFAVKTNSGPLWTTVADDFPFDVGVGGEQIRVNSITGGSSPQTFNVTRSRNGVVKSHLINAPVSLWAPLVLGL